MRYSQSLIVTRRDAPADAETTSHQLMVRAGFIRKLASGIYTYLPLCLRTLRKIEQIIREEMNAAGAQELLMPMVQPSELWKESERWEVYGKELLRLKDRKDNDFCLGPTHEEVITNLISNTVKSYRQLPLNLYQIQTKFRDEIRPRFGLMRGREFIMKDAYSFDVNEEASHATYEKMYQTYVNIFTRCGLDFRPVEAASGNIGGTKSHEFHVLASSGEDEVFSCPQCDYAVSAEKAPEAKQCPNCSVDLKSFRGIEVGHVFYLGDKYSQSMKAVYLDDNGKEQHIVMGCYGIGVGRTAAAAIEQNHDEFGMIWPRSIAPYEVALLSLKIEDAEVARVSAELYQQLQDQGIEVIWDDRRESPGVKFKDADLIGFPFQIVVGLRGLKDGQVEIKSRQTGEKVSVALNQLESELKQRLKE